VTTSCHRILEILKIRNKEKNFNICIGLLITCFIMWIVSSFSFLNNPRDDINGPPKYDNQRPLNPGGDKGKTNSMLVISNPIQILKFFSLFRIFRISRILWQDVVTTEIIKIILISTMTTNANSKWHCTHDYHFYFMIIIMWRRVLLSKMWASIKTKAGCNLYSKTVTHLLECRCLYIYNCWKTETGKCGIFLIYLVYF
jgi:hypothetical protein